MIPFPQPCFWEGVFIILKRFCTPHSQNLAVFTSRVWQSLAPLQPRGRWPGWRQGPSKTSRTASVLAVTGPAVVWFWWQWLLQPASAPPLLFSSSSAVTEAAEEAQAHWRCPSSNSTAPSPEFIMAVIGRSERLDHTCKGTEPPAPWELFSLPLVPLISR